MRNRLPAPIREARAAADGARLQFRRHRSTCSQCNAAASADQWARCCDTGWAMVKYERITAAQLRAAEHDREASAPLQLALF